MRKSFIYLVSFLLLAQLASAQIIGPVPDLYLSSYWIEYPGAEPVGLYVVPDASGVTFYEARLMDGSEVDARIHVRLIDGMGIPIQFYPAEDIWLDSQDSHLALCSGGSVADGDTDFFGHTSWYNPLRAGGYSLEPTVVVVSGAVLAGGPGVNLHFNSPDLNGDLSVNLTDVSLFAGDFFGVYHFRSDLAFDGTINLSDVSRLALAVGRSCP